MIEISGLIKKYGEKTVLDIEQTQLEKGASYAIIGANGSGKTTLLRILAGTLEYEVGSINLHQKDKGKQVGSDRIAYMPQRNFAFDISVLANLTIVKNDKQKALKVLKAVELDKLAKRKGSKLSGGEMQRLALARLLMIDYDIMLLDEPTFAMDINSAQIAEQVIADSIKEKGATLIFSTHSMHQAARLADEIIFLHEGRICERARADTFLGQPQTKEAVKFLQYFSG